MDKHYQVLKRMIEDEIEVSYNMVLELDKDGLYYSINGNEAIVWDEEKEELVGDYSDDVFDLVTDAIQDREVEAEAVRETMEYLRSSY